MVSSVSPDWLMTMTRVALAHHGVAVPELGGQAHLHRAAQQPLQVVLAHHAHMVADEPQATMIDAADVPDLLRRHGQVLAAPPGRPWMRAAMALRMAAGCSMISLSMKWS